MMPGPKAIARLRTRFAGEVILSSAPDYHVVRQVFNARESRRPAVIARCRGAADVMAAVKFAREHGLQISVKGGGHGPTGFAVCDDGLLIDLSLMRGVLVDPVDRTATVQAGALWKDVDREAQPFGLVPTGGSCEMVGVTGMTLGGGWSYLSRSFGLAIDNLESVQIVTADATLETASANEHPDLFWALRGGGGGNFGVVTSLRYRLHPLPKKILVGTISWPYEKAGDVLARYGEQVPSLEDPLYIDANLGVVDGKPNVSLSCVYLGSDEAAGRAWLKPFIKTGRPRVDLRMRPYGSFLKEYADTVVQGRLQLWKSGFVKPEALPKIIDTIVGHFEQAPGSSSPVFFIETLGGAISRVDSRETAYPHRDQLMCLTIVALWDDVARSEEVENWVRKFKDALRPGLSRAVYVNYPDVELENWPRAYYGNNYPRLVQIKRAYDRNNVFRFAQSIGSDVTCS